MTRRSPAPDPEAARHLRAIDDTLGGRRVEADLAEIEELVHAVRAQRPRPRPEWIERLDARAEAGFSAPRRSTGTGLAALRARVSRRTLVPVLGAAASLMLVVVVASSLIQDGAERRDAPTGAGGGAQTLQAPRAAESRDSSPPSLPTPVDPAPGERQRRVERRASLVLQAPADRVDEVADGVLRVTDGVGGIVASSSVTDGSRGGASFQLRIPSDRLPAALSQLSRLGKVRSRNQSSLDVTGSFVSARDRLNEELAERRGLLRQLASADSRNETDAIRQRLRINAQEIGDARTALNEVRQRTDYAVVDVTVERAGRGGAGGPGDGDWTPGDALRDALGILSVCLGVALVTLAVLLPVGLVGLVGALASRAVLRRRREQALASG